MDNERPLRRSKFKPENPGLQALQTQVFGFEKTPGYPGFRVRVNPGWKP